MTMNSKTRNRIKGSVDLVKLGVEENTPLGMIEDGTRVMKDAYAIRTGKRVRLSDLPSGVRTMERRK